MTENNNTTNMKFPKIDSKVMMGKNRRSLSKTRNNKYAYVHYHKESITREIQQKAKVRRNNGLITLVILLGAFGYFLTYLIFTTSPLVYIPIALLMFAILGFIAIKFFRENPEDCVKNKEIIKKLQDFGNFRFLAEEVDFKAGKTIRFLVQRPFNKARASKLHQCFAARIFCHELVRTSSGSRTKETGRVVWRSLSKIEPSEIKDNQLVADFSFEIPTDVPTNLDRKQRNARGSNSNLDLDNLNNEFDTFTKPKIFWTIQIYEPYLNVDTYIPIMVYSETDS